MFKDRNLALIAALSVMTLISCGVAVHYRLAYIRLQEAQSVAAPASMDLSEADRLKAEVARLVALPNEEPVIATVTDPSLLTGQTFFATAKAGDKVLIFTESKKAILYDPTAKKILEVAPLGNGLQPK